MVIGYWLLVMRWGSDDEENFFPTPYSPEEAGGTGAGCKGELEIEITLNLFT